MAFLKTLFLIIITFNFFFAQVEITIYNQGRAFIKETRQVHLDEIGEKYISIHDIPQSVDPSSITLFSKDINFISKEFINRSITIQSMLNEFIGKEIELVKYGDDGKISFSTLGKLLSNHHHPVFEIDGKIVIHPPYDYRFNEIPLNIKNSPNLQCLIQSKSINANYHLSYLTPDITWNAEYNLYLNINKKSQIKGWYAITNNLEIEYSNANISMISGEINFNNDRQSSLNSNNRLKTAGIINDKNTIPSYFLTEDYHVFNLPKEIILKPKSQIRHKFLSKNKIPYESIYHVSHSLQRYRKNISKNENIPVNVRITLKALDIVDFQLPGGLFNVYENNADSFTFIGSGKSSISENQDIIIIETGKTRDIVCKFFIKSHKTSQAYEETEIKAMFKNRKNYDVSIVWMEKFHDGGWEIYKANNNHERIDAYTAKFDIDIPANSNKEISFKARIEKN